MAAANLSSSSALMRDLVAHGPSPFGQTHSELANTASTTIHPQRPLGTTRHRILLASPILMLVHYFNGT